MPDAVLTELIDEWAKWEQLTKEAKAEIEKIKAKIQKIAVPEIENSKLKTVRYFGSNNNIVTVSESESLKMGSYMFLKLVLGNELTGEFIKEEKTYKMTEGFKRIVTPLCSGKYIEQTLDSIIQQMEVDEATSKLLKKKLKGDPQKDAKVLASVNIPQEDIHYWIYFIAEAIAWEKIVKLLQAAGYQEGTEGFVNALNGIKQALIVEEGLKIGIEYEDDSTANVPA